MSKFNFVETNWDNIFIPSLSKISTMDEVEKLNYLQLYHRGFLYKVSDQYIFECGPSHFEWPSDASFVQISNELKRNGWNQLAHISSDGPPYEYIHQKMRTMLYKLLCEMSRKYPGFMSDLGPFPPFDSTIKFKPSCLGAEHGYIRFGDVPKCGYSKNYLFDEPEAGVSCFEAEIMPSGNFKLIRLTPQLQCEAAFYSSDSNRPMYRLYGERVGYGWSGDPLLNVMRIERVTGHMQ